LVISISVNKSVSAIFISLLSICSLPTLLVTDFL
jgi:hypothetical protein